MYTYATSSQLWGTDMTEKDAGLNKLALNEVPETSNETFNS